MTLAEALQQLNAMESEIIRLRNDHLPKMRAQIAELRARIPETLYKDKVEETPTRAGIVPLKMVEKETILRAIGLVPHIPRCAKLLGMGRTTLYRKLQQFEREGDYKMPPAQQGSEECA